MKMTDLEMTKLCAEAMGLRVEQYGGSLYALYEERPRHRKYCPLNSDDQAMALVKRFPYECLQAMHNDIEEYMHFPNRKAPDFNRAIVECVARKQATSSVATT